MDWGTLVGLILGGGGVVGLITALVTHRRDTPDITKTNIETALKLRDEALEAYSSTEEKLKVARRLIQEAEAELEFSRRYIKYLTSILEGHGVPFDCAEKYRSQIKKTA